MIDLGKISTQDSNKKKGNNNNLYKDRLVVLPAPTEKMNHQDVYPKDAACTACMMSKGGGRIAFIVSVVSSEDIKSMGWNTIILCHT